MFHEYESPFAWLLKECERKERARIAERERNRERYFDERMAELMAMAEEVSAWK